MTSETVTDVQEMLHNLGFYGGKVDGYFGPVTFEAVKQFQMVTYVPVDGWFGPITCAKLNERYKSYQEPTTSENLENKIQAGELEDVELPQDACDAPVSEFTKILQSALRRLGYFPIYAPDGSGRVHLNGKYCYYTQKAVSDFQRDNKLVVDGVFGPVTKAKLIEKISPALKEIEDTKKKKDEEEQKRKEEREKKWKESREKLKSNGSGA